MLLILSVLLLSALAQNPFLGQTFYVNPSYQAELDISINNSSGIVKQNLQQMRNVASAYWIDVMSKIHGTGTNSVQGILADAASKNPPHLVLFIIYDLPNRDCHAMASNGEICCYPNSDGTCNYNTQGDCGQGIKKYQTQYIDPIVQLFAQYQNKVPIVALIEPDSLPNLATNMADPRCGNPATVSAYKNGIQYAVQQIAKLAPKVTMYVDAAHGGWLGWTDNTNKFVQTVSSLNILPLIRGFATNVANYQPLGVACPQDGWCLNNQHQNDPCCADPCRLESQWNPANNEANYVNHLSAAFASVTTNKLYYITDSGRNGVPNMRSNCANWCNIRNAGVGLFPTTKTTNPIVDAYFWLKTPGESDGCTQTLPNGQQCRRFDGMCASADSIGSQPGEPRAPEAGKWFDYQVKQLALNAHFNGDE